jgi:hypothetical protein
VEYIQLGQDMVQWQTFRSSGRKVTQLKITIFQEKQFNYYIFLIRVFRIEESDTANTHVGKRGILHTPRRRGGPIVTHQNWVVSLFFRMSDLYTWK